MNKLIIGSMLLLLFAETACARIYETSWTNDSLDKARKKARENAVRTCESKNKSVSFFDKHCKSQYNGGSYRCTYRFHCI
jgi:hypothetical protein